MRARLVWSVLLMALEFAHGSIQWLTADAIGTTYTVSGLSFQPKAIRFWWVGLGSATDAASQTTHCRAGGGFAVSTTNRGCVTSRILDAVTSADGAGSAWDDAVVATTTNSVRNGSLDIDAVLSDGFRLIVDNSGPIDITVNWEAWGGTDITAADLELISEPAATGNANYAVSLGGATPSAVMFFGTCLTGAVNTLGTTGLLWTAGFATSSASADQVVLLGSDDRGSATMDTDGYGRAGECIAGTADATGAIDARASLSAVAADQFTLNWVARAQTGRKTLALVIAGGNWKAGGYTINGNSAGATATVSGLSFTPGGLCLMGRMATEDAAGTTTAQNRMSLGAGSSITSRRAQGLWSEDATADAEIDLAVEYDQVLVFPSAAGGVASAYNINAMNSDGFQIIVDTAGGVASEWQGYLAFGTVVAAAASLLPNHAARRRHHLVAGGF